VLGLEPAWTSDPARPPDQMRRLLPIAAGAALLASASLGAGTAAAATAVAGAAEFAPRQLIVKFDGAARGRTAALPASAGVRASAAALRRNPRVAYAEPNYVATASATPASPLPDDPGTLAGATEAAASAGDWTFKQWNFLPWEGEGGSREPLSPGGIDAVGAWRNLEAVSRPGAEGVTVAVLDTGVAYRDDGRRFRRSPDFAAGQFVRGYDFIDRDGLPLDENGHGTHVAGTIGEKTNNGVGLTGLAYRAKLMPVRVLDRQGRGRASDIAQGIRFAVAHNAQVINMSFNFGCGKEVPEVDEALREAYAKGVVAVASAGNFGSETCVSEPATGPRVIGVGGSTEGGCLGSYSLPGEGIDLLAPGGGIPATGCPSVSARPVYQVTLRPGSTRSFAIPGNYVGTSMAAAHVSGAVALLLASRGIRPQVTPQALVNAVTRRLCHTARGLGLPSPQQGCGLLDIGRATKPIPRL
jgi:serine protease